MLSAALSIRLTRLKPRGPPKEGDVKGPKEGRKEGNVLFNDALNTFYLRLYGVRHG